MKKYLLFALPLSALLYTSCEKEKEEVWTDDSPIVKFTNPEFLSVLLESEWYDNDGNSYPVDKNGDGQISEKEASLVKHLFIDDAGLTDIEEIKYFTALKILSCMENQLTTLDLSGCTALESLYCDANQLTTLDLSNNTALVNLYCTENRLTTLDLSGCTALEHLECFENQFTTLDLSGNLGLTYLLLYSYEYLGFNETIKELILNIDHKISNLQENKDRCPNLTITYIE